MVLSSMRSPRAGFYVVQDVCEIPGPLNEDLLKQAWRRVSRRHPALRCSVEAVTGGEPGLRLHDEPAIHWQHLDWTACPEYGLETRLAEFLRSDWTQGFAFDQGVPMRFTFVRIAEDRHVLIWTSHHVLLDGRSYLVVWREWFAIYEALLRGEELPTAEPANFYPEATQPSPHNADAAERYWRGRLAGLTQTTGYLVDRIRAASPDAEQGSVKETRSLSDEQSQRLREFVRENSITLNTLIQGAWALLLSRYSGRSEVVFGVTRAGRPKDVEGAKEWVGVFIKTLPMRIEVSTNVPLVPWLQQIRSQWVEMRSHEEPSLEQIRQWSGLREGTPLFDSILVYDHQPPAARLRNQGGRWQQQDLRRFQRTDSPLTLAAYGEPQITLELIYDAGLFDRRTALAMTGHMERLLLSFLEQSGALLRQLKMLPVDEEAWLVSRVNETAAPYDHSLCAHRLFEERAQQTPLNVALDDGTNLITYADANQRANRLAWYLHSRKMGPEDRLAICMDRSAESVIAVLATLKAGAAFLPLDPDLPSGRLQTMLEDAQPRLVLCQTPHASKLAADGRTVLDLDRCSHDIAQQPAGNLPDLATAANAAYAIYTSGSTGTPKAVVMTHRSLVNHTLAISRVFGISGADRRLQFAAIGSDVFVAEVFNYLCSGASLVFGAKRDRQSVGEFLRLLEEQRITITGVASTWWNEWVVALSSGAFGLPPSLRAVIVGMERVDPTTFATWKRVTDKSVRWFNIYGPTESLTTTIYEAGSSAWENGPFVPIGKPIDNVRTYVLDNAGDLVPMGIAGELYVGGDGVARGYWNAPELTAQRFLPDRYGRNASGRLYRTGDLVFRLPDGNLVFVGRVDRQIKVRGFRVEPEEIEAALAEHPAARQCAVILDAEGKLAAYLTTHDGTAPTLEQLRSHLSRRLPAHMMAAAFFLLPEMPRTPSGKIDLLALSKGDATQLRPNASSVAPSTSSEKRLAALWQEALGSTLPIGVSDDFFKLGGDSLRATILITLIHAGFGKEVSLGDLLRAPTVAELALLLAGDEPAAGSAATQSDSMLALRSRGARVPFFGIPAAGFDPLCFRQLALHLGDDQPFFALDNPVWAEGRMRTIEELATRACKLIRDVQPTGPYVLGGYCFGGVVAFETARQLMSAGQKVQLVALFDTARPGYPKLIWNPAHLWRRMREPRCAASMAASLEPRSALAHLVFGGTLIKRRAIAQLNRAIGRRGVAPLAVAETDVYGLMGRSASMYVPGPIGIPVVQFIAEDEPMTTRVLDDPRLAWRELCQGGFHVHHLPGTHNSALLRQYAEQAAAALNELLVPANAI